MFLLAALALGLVFALTLGGKLSRLAELSVRAQPLVLIALGGQVLLFSRLGAGLPEDLVGPLHLATYALLIAFAAANIRVRPLALVLLGLVLNTIAIAANGGRMPVSEQALAGLGLDRFDGNVSTEAHRLAFLGDVFVLPRQLPLANVFSVGDVLIGLGAIALVLVVSLGATGSPPLQMRRLAAPFRRRSYRLLVAGKLVSHAGDWLTLATLMGWIYAETGSTAHVALLLLIRLAPPIVGGSIAVLVVDRLPKTRLLSTIEGLRGIVLAGAIAAVVQSSSVGVYAALAASGVLAAISNATTPAFLPALLPERELASANAGMGMAKDLAMAIGALGAGVALTTVGTTAALLADLLTFVIACCLFSLLRVQPVERPKEIRESGGLRYVASRPALLLPILSFGAASLATGLASATFPSLFDGLGYGAGGYGFALGALAVGLVFGQAIVGFSRPTEDSSRWITAGMLAMSGLFVVLALGEHAPTALLVLGLIGVVDGTTDVVYDTVLQRRAAPARLGAVFGVSSSAVALAMFIGVSFAPAAGKLVSPAGVIACGSVFLLGGALLALLGTRASAPAAAAGLTAAAR